jgi:hypothetical protein
MGQREGSTRLRGRATTAFRRSRSRLLRGNGGASEEREPAERGASIGSGELVEHVADKRRLEDRVRGTDTDACVGKPELHLAAIERVEHPRHVSVLHEPTDGDGHRGRRHAHVIREIAEHRGSFAVEVIEDADLMRADVLSRIGVAHVASMASEIDAWVVAENGGDVWIQGHDTKVWPNS